MLLLWYMRNDAGDLHRHFHWYMCIHVDVKWHALCEVILQHRMSCVLRMGAPDRCWLCRQDRVSFFGRYETRSDCLLTAHREGTPCFVCWNDDKSHHFERSISARLLACCDWTTETSTVGLWPEVLVVQSEQCRASVER